MLDSTETYMWDMVTVKILHELLVDVPIYLSQTTSGVVVNSTPLFLHVPDSNPCRGKLFLHHFMTYAFMWDPGTIYYDVEHSIIKKCLHVGPN
jgi:hypothetical protein